jgi:hypothetical protein
MSPTAAASKPHAQISTIPDAAGVTEWYELTSTQHWALKPLENNWGSLSEEQKRKWLVLSRNFPNLTSAEQEKLHSRMREWALLSPKDRTQARLSFTETQKVPQEQKLAKWAAYQSLSTEEKHKLAATAPKHPAGATPSLRPQPKRQLATPGLIAPLAGAAPAPVYVFSLDHVDPQTLLPRPARPAPLTK